MSTMDPAPPKPRPWLLVPPILVGLYLLIVIGPMLALFADLATLSPTEWLRFAIPNARQLWIWARSVALGLGVACGGMGLGLLVALGLQRLREGPLAELRWSFILLAPLPPVTHAMAWSWAVGQMSRVIAGRGLRPLSLQGWVAAWWVQVLWLAPVAIGLALVALESVDTRMSDAARLLKPDLQALMRIALPLAAPTLLAGSGILFLLSLVDYTIPSLCQINVTALDIFADYSVHNAPGRALLVSSPLLATTVIALTRSQARLRPLALAPNWHRESPGLSPAWPPLIRGAIGAAMVILLLAIGVPLISLASQIEGLDNLASALVEARAEIASSLRVAALASVISLPLAYAIAHMYTTQRPSLSRRFGNRLWWLLITLPLALPGPLVGIGLIALWNRPGWTGLGLYGSAWMPVLAALARYTPVGALVLVAALQRMDLRLLEAAQLLERRRRHTWIRIRLPLLTPGLLAAAGIVFSLTLGELSATLLVAPPGQPTLTMRIYNYLHYGASGTVAGLTLALTGLVLAFGVLVVAVLGLWRRLTAVRPEPALPPRPNPSGVTGAQEDSSPQAPRDGSGMEDGS